MPTYTLTASLVDHLSTQSTYPLVVREKIFDATKRPLAQNDVAELIAVKKGETVLRVEAEVLTADANAGTFEVGDGAGTSGYLTAVNAAAAGYTTMALRLTEGAPNTITGYTAGKHYTADDTIDLKALGANGITTGKIMVRAVILPKSPKGVN